MLPTSTDELKFMRMLARSKGFRFNGNMSGYEIFERLDQDDPAFVEIGRRQKCRGQWTVWSRGGEFGSGRDVTRGWGFDALKIDLDRRLSDGKRETTRGNVG